MCPKPARCCRGGKRWNPTWLPRAFLPSRSPALPDLIHALPLTSSHVATCPVAPALLGWVSPRCTPIWWRSSRAAPTSTRFRPHPLSSRPKSRSTAAPHGAAASSTTSPTAPLAASSRVGRAPVRTPAPGSSAAASFAPGAMDATMGNPQVPAALTAGDAQVGMVARWLQEGMILTIPSGEESSRDARDAKVRVVGRRGV